MFQAIGLVSAGRSIAHAREIKTFGWAVGAEIKTGRPKSKPRRNHTDAIPAANPIERQVIPAGTPHERQA
jgi:hypothetical protein